MITAVNPNMALFFSDNDYLESFLSYISEKNTGFICSGFTKSESLREFSEQNNIAILLTDDISYKKTARYINSETTVVLTEKPETENTDNVFEVNILQPVDEILREILKAAAAAELYVSQNQVLSSGNLYAFISPIGRSLKTTLAVAVSQLLSDRENTIYLNLEPVSGFSMLYGQDHGTDLSDLMFYIKDSPDSKVSLMLQSAISPRQGVDHITPVTNPGDLFQITCDEMIRLFQLLHGNGYKNIVVDMGSLLPGFEKLLSYSNRIFMPIRQDGMSAAKSAQFISYLRTLEDVGLEEKIVRLEPPFFKNLPLITENLRHTEVGTYMAGIMHEQL